VFGETRGVPALDAPGLLLLWREGTGVLNIFFVTRTRVGSLRARRRCPDVAMVLTVFWPTDALLQDGLFFGWYLSFQNETYAVVAGITPDTVSANIASSRSDSQFFLSPKTSEERERLTSQIAGYAYSMLKDMCALEPRILGRCLPATAAPGISRPRVDFDADVGKTQNER
jgi:hypothetical protein